VADEIDIANEQVQKALDATMRTLDTKVKENDTGKRRWCSVECRDEQERYS
jgi:hypothetical protein